MIHENLTGYPPPSFDPLFLGWRTRQVEVEARRPRLVLGWVNQSQKKTGRCEFEPKSARRLEP